MGNLGQDGFDAAEYNQEYQALPIGTYDLMVVNSELKNNKNNTGSYINLQMVVTGGEFKGRNLWQTLTWTHENEKAQNIGRAQFSQLVQAIYGDKHKISDTSELHNKPFAAVVGLEQTEAYGARNKIRKFVSKSTNTTEKTKAPWD